MKSNGSKTTSFNNNLESSFPSEYDSYQLQLPNIRVISKKIVYLIGIPIEIADEEILMKKEYLGQYGSIQKIIVNKNGYLKNESDSPTYSSYVTYSNEVESSLALLSLNNSTLFNHKLNACYGTNKYCNSFLKGVECNNKDCFYLHQLANKDDIIINNNSQLKKQFIEQQKIATEIADIFSKTQREIYINKGLEAQKEFEEKKISTFFPTINTIYEKKFVQDILASKERATEEFSINNYNTYYSDKKKFSKENNNYSMQYYNKDLSSKESFKYNDSEELNNSQNEEEYILVRQPSRNKRIYGGNKKAYKRNYYKKYNKLKYTLENYRIKYNLKIKEENNQSSPRVEHNLLKDFDEQNKNILSDNSNQNLSGYNTNESSSGNNQQEEGDNIKKVFFKTSKKSRFSFANAEPGNLDNKQSFVVPEFVKEILSKKFYCLCFTNFCKINKSIDSLETLFLDEEIKIIKKWANAD